LLGQSLTRLLNIEDSATSHREIGFHQQAHTIEGCLIMKLDTYTKVVLTGIAVFLGVIAFDYRPNMEAKAGIMGGGEMIMKQGNGFTHMKDGKFRFCSMGKDQDLPFINRMSRFVFECSPFTNGFTKGFSK